MNILHRLIAPLPVIFYLQGVEVMNEMSETLAIVAKHVTPVVHGCLRGDVMTWNELPARRVQKIVVYSVYHVSGVVKLKVSFFVVSVPDPPILGRESFKNDVIVPLNRTQDKGEKIGDPDRSPSLSTKTY